MVNPGIEQMVNQLRAVAAQAAGSPSSSAETSSGVDFSTMLQSAVNEVNSAQKSSETMTQQFEEGDPNANLQDVVVSLQKASLSFQTMVQVRNKLVSAYQEIMNMQV